MIEALMRLDRALLLAISGLQRRFAALDWVMRLLATDYFVPVALALFLVGLWFSGVDRREREHNQRTVLAAGAGMGLSNGFVSLVNRFVPAPRPFVEMPWLLDGVKHILYIPSDPSFPSNIATVSFAMAAGVWLGNARAGKWLLIPALLVSFARVYAGVHFPSDIVGGAAIGLLAAVAAHAILLPLFEPVVALMLSAARKLCLA